MYDTCPDRYLDTRFSVSNKQVLYKLYHSKFHLYSEKEEIRFATFHKNVTLLYEKHFSTQMKLFTDENLCKGKI